MYTATGLERRLANRHLIATVRETPARPNAPARRQPPDPDSDTQAQTPRHASAAVSPSL